MRKLLYNTDWSNSNNNSNNIDVTFGENKKLHFMTFVICYYKWKGQVKQITSWEGKGIA